MPPSPTSCCHQNEHEQLSIKAFVLLLGSMWSPTCPLAVAPPHSFINHSAFSHAVMHARAYVCMHACRCCLCPAMTIANPIPIIIPKPNPNMHECVRAYACHACIHMLSKIRALLFACRGTIFGPDVATFYNPVPLPRYPKSLPPPILEFEMTHIIKSKNGALTRYLHIYNCDMAHQTNPFK